MAGNNIFVDGDFPVFSIEMRQRFDFLCRLIEASYENVPELYGLEEIDAAVFAERSPFFDH